MNSPSPNAVDLAELLIQEGKKQEARALLATYLKRNPTSARAWWVLSQAVETPAQERDCLERVLVLEPEHAQAQARLAQLRPPPTKHVKPFTASLPSERVEKPLTVPPPPSAAPQKEQEPSTPAWASRPVPDLKPAPPDRKPAASDSQFAPPFPPAPTAASPTVSPGSPPPFPPASSSAAEPSYVPPWAEPPAPSAGNESPVQKPPRRKKFGVLQIVMIFILLCLVFAAVAFFALQKLGQTVADDIYATQTVAWLLTSRPLPTLEPSWTFTARPSLTPTETLVPTETPTLTPTSLYTPTETAIPTNAIGLVVGKYPPDFMLTNAITGEQVSLSTYLGKQPVVLFFWATWCPFCKNEIPYLQAVYQKYQADGLVVLAIDADPTDSLTSVIQTINQYGMTFPVLMDQSGEIGQQYAIEAVPYHIFIGRTGRIVSAAEGGLSEKVLEGQVMSIMRIFPTSTP
jgi:peroxiredoxin